MATFVQIIGRIVVPLLIASAVFYAAYIYLEREPEFTPSVSGVDEVLERDLRKIKLQDALVEGFEAKKELITQEVELSETARWDESWGTFDIFHKSQQVRFFGIGIYVCDLNGISGGDISVNHSSKKIRVRIPPPFVKSVSIDETKTEYEDVSKGWLRTGSIKLTQRQNAAMYLSVKQSMEERMKSPELLEAAEESSKETVKEIFDEILMAFGENYTVSVYIK